MENNTYTLADLTPEEAESLTKEITEVLAKYNAEIGVTSKINIMKRVEDTKGGEEIISPLQSNGEGLEETSKTD